MSNLIKPTKTAIITGGNSGLGFECARCIARDPEWQIVIASRDRSKSEQAVRALISSTGNEYIQAITLDLASLASVREFVAAIIDAQLPPLKAIICNAGVQNISNTFYTEDGFEMTFGVNHLGHFLLTNLLLPNLVTPARIVFVSSGTHDPKQNTLMPPPVYTTARDLAFPSKDDAPRSRDLERLGMQRYSTSKLCNILCVYEFIDRLKTAGYSTLPKLITVNAFDPGLMPGTGLARDYNPVRKFIWSMIGPILVPFIPNANSASRSGQELARLILDPGLETTTGKYFDGTKEITSSDASYDKVIRKDLWKTSIDLVSLSPAETIPAMAVD